MKKYQLTEDTAQDLKYLLDSHKYWLALYKEMVKKGEKGEEIRGTY